MNKINNQTNPNVSDKNKLNLLKFLVFLFIIIIAVFWITNLKSSWQTRSEDDPSLNTLKVKLESNLEKLELRITDLEVEQIEIKKMISQEKAINDSKDLLKNISEELDKRNKIEEVDEMLDSEKVDDSRDEKSGSERVIWQQNNCPQWLNCMPMIDSEPKNCQIPTGCEGYTQIAY